MLWTPASLGKRPLSMARHCRLLPRNLQCSRNPQKLASELFLGSSGFHRCGEWGSARDSSASWSRMGRRVQTRYYLSCTSGRRSRYITPKSSHTGQRYGQPSIFRSTPLFPLPNVIFGRRREDFGSSVVGFSFSRGWTGILFCFSGYLMLQRRNPRNIGPIA